MNGWLFWLVVLPILAFGTYYFLRFVVSLMAAAFFSLVPRHLSKSSLARETRWQRVQGKLR